MNSLDIPMYPVATAGRLVGLSAGRARRWLKGYEYEYQVGPDKETRRKQKAPVVRRNTNTAIKYATFLDLIDLRFIKEFVEHGIKLQKLRDALIEADKLLKGHHHFAKQIFFTDGSHIFLQIKDAENSEALMELLSGGQWVIAPIIKQLAHQIVFDRSTGFAKKWYPMGINGHIVLDPSRSFGQPIIVERGITTSVVYDFFLGEKKNLKRVCSWMELNENEVKAAVDFETQILKAA